MVPRNSGRRGYPPRGSHAPCVTGLGKLNGAGAGGLASVGL